MLCTWVRYACDIPRREGVQRLLRSGGLRVDHLLLDDPSVLSPSTKGVYPFAHWDKIYNVSIRCCGYEKDHSHRIMLAVYRRVGICIPALSPMPESVQVGLPLNCSVDSNFPVGTPFEFVFYQSSAYTATPISRQNVTIQKNNATIYQAIDTKGLSGGQYKVEALISRTDEEKLSSDSKTWQLPILIDRSGDITITSPLSQTFDEALRIEGSITKAGIKSSDSG